MAGVGLGNMLINVLCFAIAQGMNGALETFCSQAFGLGKLEMVGVYHMRGRYVVTLLMIPIIMIFMVTEDILSSIEQDETISRYAEDYVCWMIPGCWAMTQFDACKKFLIAQNK
jgi:MATE family multidrug resistance protein